MLNAYSVSHGTLEKLECSINHPALSHASWIDLVDPTREEELAVEALLTLEIPSRAEMRSIEASSAAYHAGGASVMTARVVSRSGTAGLKLLDVTFILKANVLTTLRYGDPLPFRAFVARAERAAAIPRLRGAGREGGGQDRLGRGGHGRSATDHSPALSTASTCGPCSSGSVATAISPPACAKACTA